ncbi:hypothetical protein [Streptomyces sp. NPDC048248]|uniref:hypothetical protein n=1 Tax=Streptomyces sp. NPDC048248 TaxID=3365523 RepID=UPI003717CAD1
MSKLPAFSYDGEAVVVTGSTEIQVHARLLKRFHQPFGEEWHGTMTPLDPNEDFWAVDEAGTAVLHTAQGREAILSPGDN